MAWRRCSFQTETRKRKNSEPQHHSGEEGQDGQGVGSKADNGEFDGEQDEEDQDANLDQPGQPVALIGDGVHENQLSAVSHQPSVAGRRREMFS
jgi:hypothetical protein